MKNTLQIDDRILVDEITPRFGGYARGDIVVFRDPGGWLEAAAPPHSAGPLADAADWFLSLIGFSVSDSDDHLIKRVIGLPGDHVVCCNALGQITVNGAPIDESSYILVRRERPPPRSPSTSSSPPVRCGCSAIIGTTRGTRAITRTSRGHGFVPIGNVVGRAFLITWPLNRFGPLDFHHGVFASVPSPVHERRDADSDGRAGDAPCVGDRHRVRRGRPGCARGAGRRRRGRPRCCGRASRGARGTARLEARPRGPVARRSRRAPPSAWVRRVPSAGRARRRSTRSASCVRWDSRRFAPSPDLAAHGCRLRRRRCSWTATTTTSRRLRLGPSRCVPWVKADRDCASAAAASVIAKVSRDTLMGYLHEDLPAYCWDRNKGNTRARITAVALRRSA